MLSKPSEALYWVVFNGLLSKNLIFKRFFKRKDGVILNKDQREIYEKILNKNPYFEEFCVDYFYGETGSGKTKFL